VIQPAEISLGRNGMSFPVDWARSETQGMTEAEPIVALGTRYCSS
jgi:hypothetical protein